MLLVMPKLPLNKHKRFPLADLLLAEGGVDFFKYQGSSLIVILIVSSVLCLWVTDPFSQRRVVWEAVTDLVCFSSFPWL